MRQALAWAREQDAAVALRLAVALAPWWYLRARLAEAYPLLREAAAHAAVAATYGATHSCGSATRCITPVTWPRRWATSPRPAMPSQAGRRAGRLRYCLAARTGPLAHLGRITEAVDDGHQALALTRELGYPFGEYLALTASRSPPRRPATSMAPWSWHGRPGRSPATSPALPPGI